MNIWILIYFFIGWITIFLGGQYGDWSRWQNELIHSINLTYNYYLARLSIGGLFGQYWTLFVEIHFSIFFILLFGIVRNMKIRQYLSIVFILLTVFCFRPLTPVGEVRFVTHAHLDALFAGVLIALVENQRKVKNYSNNRNLHKQVISIVLCLVMLLSGYFFDTYYNVMSIKYVFYATVGCLMFILAKENNGWFNYGKVINRFLDFAGDASASTYVSHIILYSCVYHNIYYNTTVIPIWIKTTFWGTVIQVVMLELVAIAIGWLSLHLIEKPYILLAKKIIEKQN